MENHDALILHVELDSLAVAHQRREEVCRRRAGLLMAQADRHAAIAKLLSGMLAPLPQWENTEDVNHLGSHFFDAFCKALAAADVCETPARDAGQKKEWPDPGADIPF